MVETTRRRRTHGDENRRELPDTRIGTAPRNQGWRARPGPSEALPTARPITPQGTSVIAGGVLGGLMLRAETGISLDEELALHCFPWTVTGDDIRFLRETGIALTDLAGEGQKEAISNG